VRCADPGDTPVSLSTAETLDRLTGLTPRDHSFSHQLTFELSHLLAKRARFFGRPKNRPTLETTIAWHFLRRITCVGRPHLMQLVWLDQLTSECATDAS